MEISGEGAEGVPQAIGQSSNSVDLILRARQGEGAAWEALVRQHQEPVFRLAYLFLGDPDEAEDVAQETFIRAFQALERFDTSRPLRPWLFSIAANLARNRRRSMGRLFNALQKLLREEPQLDRGESSDQELNWQSKSLWEAVRHLGLKEQEIVYLRIFLELSVEETAQSLGVAAGTVKSRLSRALQRLRQVIEREYPELKDYWV